MDEGEEHKADAFDLHDHMAVFLDSLHEARVTLKRSARHKDVVFLLKVGLIEYLTACGVVGCEQPQEVNGFLRYALKPPVGGIAVDPEGERNFLLPASEVFEADESVVVRLDEQHVRNQSVESWFPPRGITEFLGEENLLAIRLQGFFSDEVLTGPDGEPGYVFLGKGQLA